MNTLKRLCYIAGSKRSLPAVMTQNPNKSLGCCRFLIYRQPLLIESYIVHGNPARGLWSARRPSRHLLPFSGTRQLAISRPGKGCPEQPYLERGSAKDTVITRVGAGSFGGGVDPAEWTTVQCWEPQGCRRSATQKDRQKAVEMCIVR